MATPAFDFALDGFEEDHDGADGLDDNRVGVGKGLEDGKIGLFDGIEGADGFFDDAGLPTGEGWDQTDLPLPRPSLFSLQISGDSMAPLYRQGDRVLVDRDRTDVRKGDRVVVRTATGETMAKEVTSLTARSVTLASINPAYEPRVIPRKDIDWMARILWVSQ